MGDVHPNINWFVHFGIFVLIVLPIIVKGQIVLTSATYLQDFNELSASGTSDLLPLGWAMVENGVNGDLEYSAGTGSSNRGDTYSFGSDTSRERALGMLRSANISSLIGAFFINRTGNTINEITIEYTGEQWRLGALGREDRLHFQYSTTASASLDEGSWTDYEGLDFVSPEMTGIVGRQDGNLVTNRSNVTATITGLALPDGAVLAIRWSDVDATGADDGLAIDDFTLTVSSYCNITLSDFYPKEGPVGTVVSILGINFSGTSSVFFNNVQSQFVVVSSGLITATVPVGATSGLITIVNGCTTSSLSPFFLLDNSCTTGASDLIISEYIEGSSHNKAIEVANFTGNPLNLSAYSLVFYSNGNTKPSQTIRFPNVDLPNNRVWVVVESDASDALKAYANQLYGIAWFNGNDAVALLNGAVMIDLFGNIGCDPGSTWESNGIQTTNVTLVRNPFVINGVSSDPAVSPCLFPTLGLEWTQYPIDDYSHLSGHVVSYQADLPVVTLQPTGATVCCGEEAVLPVLATNATHYQWQRFNGTEWESVVDQSGRYSGSTTTSLSIVGSDDINNSQYLCRVYTTDQCFVVSNGAQLSVIPLPVLHASGHNPEMCHDIGTIDFVTTNVPEGTYSILYDGGSFLNVEISNGEGTVNAQFGEYDNLTIASECGISPLGVDVTIVETPDTLAPTFTIPNPVTECVGDLISVVYNPATLQVEYNQPDYFILFPGDTILDLSDINDNCSISEDITIYWRIDFQNEPSQSLAGSGQLSEYNLPIQFPGDGVDYSTVTHTITYWVVDAAGNSSETQVLNVTIMPRPHIESP